MANDKKKSIFFIIASLQVKILLSGNASLLKGIPYVKKSSLQSRTYNKLLVFAHSIKTNGRAPVDLRSQIYQFLKMT